MKKNALDCQKHCTRKEGCTFWSYDRQNGWCYLHPGGRKDYKKLSDGGKLKKDVYLNGDVDCVPEDNPANARIKGKRRGRGRRGRG